MSLEKQSSQKTSSDAQRLSESERFSRGGRDAFQKEFRQLMGGKADEPMSLEPTTGCLAIIIILVGLIVLLLGFGLALGKMTNAPDKMATDLPWGNYPFAWLSGGFVLGLVGLGVLEVARTRSEKAALEKEPHLYQSKNLEEQNKTLEDEIARFISDPVGLNALSGEELDHLRLRVQSLLERSEREFTDEEKDLLRKLNTPEMQVQLSTPILGTLFNAISPHPKAREKQNRIDDLKLLLKLIATKQHSRIETPPERQLETVPTQAQQREKILAKLQILRLEKASVLEQLKESHASEDDIRRYKNIYDNSIHRLETELATLLIE
ncbi:MAG: hypothetical protein V7638_424 [Acidobacteriota bacterium]|jgi:hypothetical protein